MGQHWALKTRIGNSLHFLAEEVNQNIATADTNHNGYYEQSANPLALYHWQHSRQLEVRLRNVHRLAILNNFLIVSVSTTTPQLLCYAYFPQFLRL